MSAYADNPLKKLFSKALSAVFPRRCPFCRALVSEKELICGECTKKLPKTDYTRYAIGGFQCCAPLPYKDEYARAVKSFKFGKKRDYAHALAHLAVGAAEKKLRLNDFDCVTCVPMHRRSLRKRGFNQAEALAREFAKLTDLPYVELLEKYKANKPQHKLKRSERFKNVKGVFRVIDPAVVKDNRVILIDDIITTGSTLGECSRLLKKSGAKAVCCAAVCASML